MAFYGRMICRRLLSTATISRSWSRHRMSKRGESVFSSPCLMLPSALDDNNNGYKLYSLAEKRVQTLPQTGLKYLAPNPIHDLRLCGSSHGWIGLFNPETLDLFIYNPVSLRHIKLPLIHNLPNYPEYNKRSVAKLILSSSPDEDRQNCRAVIIYNCGSKSAFCCPGQTEWTPIGNTYLHWGDMVWTTYRDFVYSSRQNLFFGLTQFSELETWDLTDPSSPRLIKTIDTDYDKYFSPPLPTDIDIFFEPQSTYMVVAGDVILLLTRHVIEEVAPDGTHHDYFRPSILYPHMTIGFRVDVYDPHKNDDILTTGLDTLGDLALFVGTCSDSVVLSPTKYPELKLNSNSIYFTDHYMERTDSRFKEHIFGGHDIGIFDFENKTVSSCYYPCHLPSLKRIAPSPMWFFPRPI